MSQDSLIEVTTTEHDAQLWESFLDQRSEAVFGSLVERYSPLVLGVCRRMLPAWDADDAAQAVFVLLWQKARELKPDVILAGWLHRTARHLCQNALRAKQSRHRHEERAGQERLSMKQDPVDREIWAELRPLLDEEIDRLPDKWRVPFVLFHLENLSLAEVASLVGSPAATVGTWLHRCRAKLADRLRRRGVEVTASSLAAVLSASAAAEAATPALIASTVQAAAHFVGASTAGVACSPAVAGLVKIGMATSVGFKAWIVAGVLAAAVILPTSFVWVAPIVKTRQSHDFSLLEGDWSEVAHEQDGRSLDAQPEVDLGRTLVISDRHFRRVQMLAGGKMVTAEQGTFLLDDFVEPKAINFQCRQGTIHAIYKIDGDSLTLCAAKNGLPRPDSFTTTQGDERSLTSYVRSR